MTIDDNDIDPLQQTEPIGDVLNEVIFEQHDMVPYNKPTKRAPRTTKQDQKQIQHRQQSSNHILDDMLNDLDQTLDDMAPVDVSGPSHVKTVAAKSPTKKRATKAQYVLTAAEQEPLATIPATTGPKMIHTQKTRVVADDGKRRSRTMVVRREPTPPPPPAPAPVATPPSRGNRSKRGAASTSQTLVTTPTKQTRHSTKQDRDLDNSLVESDLLLELAKKNLNYSSDVVNDLEEILRSPIKLRETSDEHAYNDLVTDDALTADVDLTQTHNTRNSKRINTRQTQIRATPIKTAVAPTRAKSARTSTRISKQSADDELINSIVRNIKQEKEESYTMTSEEFFTCEMCSAVFRDRAQLLVHVPIHI